MYPEVEHLSPFGNAFTEYPTDANFFSNDALDDLDIDPELLMDDEQTPALATGQDQPWSAPFTNSYNTTAQDLYHNSTSSSAFTNPLEQAIMYHSQQSTAQNGGPVHSTVSPAQLFQPPARIAAASRSPPASSTVSSAPKSKDSRARKASVPVKAESTQKVGSSSTSKLAPKRAASATPPSPPPSIKKKAAESVDFDKIKKDYLNPNAKYGWHGRFEKGKPNPLDEMTRAISEKKINMTAAQAAEFASLAFSGIPTAYTRTWQDHDGGLKLLSTLLHRAVEGLRTSPTGKWVEASYKLVDLLKKISPKLQELGTYDLASAIKAIQRTEGIDKELKKFIKASVETLKEAAEASEDTSAAGQKRAAPEAEQDAPVKRSKLDAQAKPGQSSGSGPTKTVVKVAPKKTDKVDMSAFGLAPPRNSAGTRRPVPKADAVSSLLSGLNSTIMNGQANSKTVLNTALEIKPRYNGKPRKTVRFQPDDKLVAIQWIENRDDDEYESGGANTTQMEGEGKFMKEHGRLEEQQDWYEPLAFDVDEPVEPENLDATSTARTAFLESLQGRAVLDDNAPGFTEVPTYRDVQSQSMHGDPMEYPEQPAQAMPPLSQQPADLKTLLSRLQGSNSPAPPAQGADFGGGNSHGQAAVQAAPAPTLHIDMGTLSNILSKVNAQTVSAASAAHNPYHQPPMNLNAQPAYNFNQFNHVAQAPQSFGYNAYQDANHMSYQPNNTWMAPQDEAQPNLARANNGRQGKDRGKCYEFLNYGFCPRPKCKFPHVSAGS